MIGQKFKGHTSLKEPWYGSDYNIRKIDPRVIEKWSQVEHDGKFYLPARNEFIPTDFTLVSPPPPKDTPTVPVLIQVCCVLTCADVHTCVLYFFYNLVQNINLSQKMETNFVIRKRCGVIRGTEFFRTMVNLISLTLVLKIRYPS